MVDARGEARLVEEHLDELGLAREVRVQPLDGDEALEAADARQAREEHRGHAAGRELGDQLEAIEPLAVPLDGDELAQRLASLGSIICSVYCAGRPSYRAAVKRCRTQRGRRPARARHARVGRSRQAGVDPATTA